LKKNQNMNDNRLMQQVNAVFSIFMVFFYLGVGIFFIFFSKQSSLDKAVWVIMGSTFIVLGLYRMFRAVNKIREAFFNKGHTSHRNMQ
jgi:hypothetical protein